MAEREFPMCVSNSMITKNYLTANFFWRVKSCMKTTSVAGVERYICLLNIVDLENMKCYRYFTSLVP